MKERFSLKGDFCFNNYYLFEFVSIQIFNCSFGTDFLLPIATTGKLLSFLISLYRLTAEIPSTSAASGTESITGISSKSLYTFSPFCPAIPRRDFLVFVTFHPLQDPNLDYHLRNHNYPHHNRRSCFCFAQ